MSSSSRSARPLQSRTNDEVCGGIACLIISQSSVISLCTYSYNSLMLDLYLDLDCILHELQSILYLFLARSVYSVCTAVYCVRTVHFAEHRQTLTRLLHGTRYLRQSHS